MDMTRYLNAVVAHETKSLPLSDKVRFTEDTVEMKPGEGLWKTASKLRSYRVDFIDVQTGMAAVHTVFEENGGPVLFAARLKVVDRKISEIETMVVRNRAEGVLFAPENLKALSKRGITDLPNAPRILFEDETLWHTALKLKTFVESSEGDPIYFGSLDRKSVV